jgi:lysophospholipase L1-like esterase
MKNTITGRAPLLACALMGVASFCPQALRMAPAQTPTVTTPLPADARFAREINAFQERDQKQMPPANAVLFVGSSSVRLWDTLTQDFAELPVVSRGFGGSDIEDSIRYADRIVIPYKPKMIVLFAGTNDIGLSRKSPQRVVKDFQEFATKIHQALPDTRVAFLSISPTLSRWKYESEILETNYLIQRWIFETNSPKRKLTFIDTHAQLLTPDGQPRADLLQTDGLHFNARGYRELTALIKPRILALAGLDGVARLEAPAREAK